jgi:tRNA-dihydrouridine synthase B
MSSPHPRHLQSLLAMPPTGEAWQSPVLALAPMQDVTDHRFIHLLHRYGGADVAFAEYFRVTAVSRLDPEILRCATENHTGRPVVLQMIGNDVQHLVRTARELQNYPVAGIDLNLGCPAPIVFNKCAGGGLLTQPDWVDRILGELRQAITRVPFTVKTRIGVDAADLATFRSLLSLFARHQPDLLTVHGRTVKEMYRPPVHYDFIAEAVAAMPCPVLANGDIDSPAAALRVLRQTGARGVMLGRGAIRNPWLFDQIRAVVAGRTPVYPGGRQVLRYIQELYSEVTDAEARELDRVNRVKKHLNFLGLGIPSSSAFLHAMRRCQTEAALFSVAKNFLDHDEPLSLTPEPASAPDQGQSHP